MAELVTRESVAQVYIATFDRAPDAAGLDYWVNDSGLSMDGIANSFFDQPETAAMYPNPSNDYANFVNTIYNNIFNRDAEQAGLDYWVAQLEDGTIAPGSMILAIANGALDSGVSSDRTILDNKLTVGLSYADADEAGDLVFKVEEATAVMDGVTWTDESVKEADDKIQEIIDGQDGNIGDSFVLTTGQDTIEGTSANDTIDGITSQAGFIDASTYTLGDIIDGKDGDDTLVLSNAANTITMNTATVTNVENLKIVDTGDALGALNLTGSTFEQVEEVNSGNATVINSAPAGTDFLFTNTAGIKTVNVAGADTATDDVLNVEVAGTRAGGVTTIVTGDTAATNNIETLNLTVSADSVFQEIEADAATALNITADANMAREAGAPPILTTVADKAVVTVTGAGNADLGEVTTAVAATEMTVTAAEMTGDLSVVLNANDIADISFTGGAGNDTLELVDAPTDLSDITFVGGAGNDTLELTDAPATAFTAKYSFDGGAGDDDTIASSEAGITAMNTSLLSQVAEEKMSLAGFETLSYTDTANGANIDLSVFGVENLELQDGATSSTFSKMTDAGTVKASGTMTGPIVINMENDTSSDSINFEYSVVTDPGGMIVDTVETINFSTVDSDPASAPLEDNTFRYGAAEMTTLNISGTENVDVITAPSATATTLVTVDGSAATGNIDLSAVVYDVGQTTNTAQTVSITTGAGNDTIVGSSVADTITLGAGNDSVAIAAVQDSTLLKLDMITDFSANTVSDAPNEGATTTLENRDGDVIDLSGITALTEIETSVQANAADATTALQNMAADTTVTGVNVALDSSTGYAYIDVDNDGQADSVIELSGVTTIDEAAFIVA